VSEWLGAYQCPSVSTKEAEANERHRSVSLSQTNASLHVDVVGDIGSDLEGQ